MNALEFLANTLDPQRTLVYAPPKSGKTAAAFGLAKLGYNVIYIGFEKGHLVLRNKGLGLSKEDYERITIVNVPDDNTNVVAETFMRLLLNGKDFTVCSAHGSSSCSLCRPDPKKPMVGAVTLSPKSWGANTVVVIDTLTQIFLSIKAGIIARQGIKDGKIEIQHWQEVGNLMDAILTRVQQVPYNVVMLTHTQKTDILGMDVKGKSVVIGNNYQPLAGSAKYGQTVGKIFDHVMYMGFANGKYVASTDPAFNKNLQQVGSRTVAFTDRDVKLDSTPLKNFYPPISA